MTIQGNRVLNQNENNPVWKNAKIIVPLKYISSFFRLLELPLIDTNLYIQLNYAKNSVISDNAGNSTFKITKTELYVPAVTLKTEDNNKLNRLLDTEFKRMNTNDNVGNPVGDPPVAPDDNNIFKRNSHRKYF